MLELTTIQQVATWILPVLFAITFHEAAHAWVAYSLGDMTAKRMGRLSFNPLRHIDPIGTVLVPLAILLVSQFNFVFGWAKPVPINSDQFKNPRRDVALATVAGPLANLLMALFWAAGLKLAVMLDPKSSASVLFLLLTAQAGIVINLLLAFLNLIPIPPLDGSRVVASLLRPRLALLYQKIEPYGFVILVILMFTGLFAWLVNPLLRASLIAIRFLFNL